MKKIVLFTFTAIFAMASIGCETTTNTNVKVNGNTVNSNQAVVTNTNSTAVNTKEDKDELTREDFDKDKEKYEKEAKDSKSGKYTWGQGANDLWLLTKTRLALAAADDLRDSTIDVDVTNDVVTLKGTVATAAQKDLAVKTSKDVEGVKDVKDNLKVDAKDSMTNQAASSVSDSDSDKKTNSK